MGIRRKQKHNKGDLVGIFQFPPLVVKALSGYQRPTKPKTSMFLKLEPDQISHYWSKIKEGLMAALPPITYADPLRMENIRLALLAGEMQSWISYGQNGHGPMLYASVVTTIAIDECSKVKNLEIYSLFGTTEHIPNDMLLEGFSRLRAFAKENQCHRIIAFTEVDRFVRLVKELGGDARYTFLALEV